MDDYVEQSTGQRILGCLVTFGLIVLAVALISLFMVGAAVMLHV